MIDRLGELRVGEAVAHAGVDLVELMIRVANGAHPYSDKGGSFLIVTLSILRHQPATFTN